VWSRFKPARKPEDADVGPASMTRVAPISLAFRSDLPWLLPAELDARAAQLGRCGAEARQVYDALKQQGALFFDDLSEITKLPRTRVEDALGELAAQGLVSSDGFSALRALVTPARESELRGRSRWARSRRASAPGGRWTLFPGRFSLAAEEDRITQWAWQLLRRYGVVFRDLLTREAAAPSWWQLVPVY